MKEQAGWKRAALNFPLLPTRLYQGTKMSATFKKKFIILLGLYVNWGQMFSSLRFHGSIMLKMMQIRLPQSTPRIHDSLNFLPLIEKAKKPATLCSERSSTRWHYGSPSSSLSFEFALAGSDFERHQWCLIVLRGFWVVPIDRLRLRAESDGMLTDTSTLLPSWAHVRWQLSTTLVITCLSLRHTRACKGVHDMHISFAQIHICKWKCTHKATEEPTFGSGSPFTLQDPFFHRLFFFFVLVSFIWLLFLSLDLSPSSFYLVLSMSLSQPKLGI